MRRDWELCRALLLRIEKMQPGVARDYGYANDLGPRDKLKYHERILSEGGLILLESVEPFGSTWRLTWYGCEVLDMIRDDRIWAAIKRRGEENAVALTVDTIKLLYQYERD